MQNSKERLVTAQWVFERTLSWIAAAEIKVGVVVAIETAMLGGLASAFGTAMASKTAWAILLSILAGTTAIIALGCAAAVFLPRLDGPKRSLLFFGQVTELSRADFSDQFRRATDDQLLDDWTEQIHRNAEIAVAKHRWVTLAMRWSFISAVPWVTAIALLVKA